MSLRYIVTMINESRQHKDTHSLQQQVKSKINLKR